MQTNMLLSFHFSIMIFDMTVYEMKSHYKSIDVSGSHEKKM